MMPPDSAGLDVAARSCAADPLAAWERDPNRLWSLWDMLRVYAHQYLQLGQELHDARLIFEIDSNFEEGCHGEKQLNKNGRDELRDELGKLQKLSKELSLPIASGLISKRMNDPPQTTREFDMLVEVVDAELRKKLFLYVPGARARYWNRLDIVSDQVAKNFPTASSEIRSAGTSFACELDTACVFHAMRAAEIGLRAFARHLGVQFTIPLEQAEWRNILDAFTPKLKEIENQKKSSERDEKLTFYSQATAQFRFFKDGWRVRVAHARAAYNSAQAKEAIDHVRSFFELLADRGLAELPSEEQAS